MLLFAASAGASAVLLVTAGMETHAGKLGTAIDRAVKSMQPFLVTPAPGTDTVTRMTRARCG